MNCLAGVVWLETQTLVKLVLTILHCLLVQNQVCVEESDKLLAGVLALKQQHEAEGLLPSFPVDSKYVSSQGSNHISMGFSRGNRLHKFCSFRELCLFTLESGLDKIKPQLASVSEK